MSKCLDSLNNTLLYYANKDMNFAVVKCLLKIRSISVNFLFVDGNTSLHYFIWRNINSKVLYNLFERSSYMIYPNSNLSYITTHPL